MKAENVNKNVIVADDRKFKSVPMLPVVTKNGGTI